MRFRPELRVLSDEQVYAIHQAALEILWNMGVLVKAPAARDLLRQAGAWVDDETMLCLTAPAPGEMYVPSQGMGLGYEVDDVDQRCRCVQENDLSV